MALPMVSLASTIAAALSKSTIKTVEEFARAVENAPGFVANLLRNEGIREQAQHLHTETGMVTDATSTQSVGTQAAVDADDMVDTATAEAMVAEALRMVDEVQERERAADERARVWEGHADFATTLLRAAEDRTDWAQAGKESAERVAAAERETRQMAEQMLAAEAALADSAVESARNERRARHKAEAEIEIWRALAGGRGGRGGRGRSRPQPPPQPPPPPPPPPPPVPHIIMLVLSVPIAQEGQMTVHEALAIFAVTESRSINCRRNTCVFLKDP